MQPFRRNQYQIERPTLSKMSDQCECPICMDTIDVTKNCVVTDCGHKFHCSCLMQNAVHNGFGCPFCRTAMAEEPKEEDDEEGDEWSDVSDEEDLYDDYALRGLRFMMNNLEGIPHDILDTHDEDEELRQEQEQTQEGDNIALPSSGFITTKLAEQGITMEDLVKALMLEHDDYDNEEQLEEFDRISNDIFGKMRIIISNYTPPVPVPTPAHIDIGLANSTNTSSGDTPATPVAHVVRTPATPIRPMSSEPKPHITPRRLVSEFIHEC